LLFAARSGERERSPPAAQRTMYIHSPTLMQRQAVAHKNSSNGSICTHTAGPPLFYYFDCLGGGSSQNYK
jgi:hypothetical protein